ncbi:MAG: hypothetical protein RR942_15930, partial [Romboutsia sp.]
MNVLNFGTYTQIIKNGITDATDTSVAKDLLGLIINKEDLFNANGESYYISPSQARKWVNWRENIPKKIKKAADSYEIEKEVASYFNENVFRKLNSLKQDDTYSTLIKLINSDTTISDEKKNSLISLHSNGYFCEFLGETFLYSIQKDNLSEEAKKIKKEKYKKLKQSKKQEDEKDKVETVDNYFTSILALKNTTNILKELYKQYPTPENQAAPEKIQCDEEIYITEILKAYADAENLSELSLDDLNNYKKYKRNFERERTCYYAAHSVEKLTKHIFCDNEIDEFHVLKEETLDGIIRIS